MWNVIHIWIKTQCRKKRSPVHPFIESCIGKTAILQKERLNYNSYNLAWIWRCAQPSCSNIHCPSSTQGRWRCLASTCDLISCLHVDGALRFQLVGWRGGDGIGPWRQQAILPGRWDPVPADLMFSGQRWVFHTQERWSAAVTSATTEPWDPGCRGHAGVSQDAIWSYTQVSLLPVCFHACWYFILDKTQTIFSLRSIVI